MFIVQPNNKNNNGVTPTTTVATPTTAAIVPVKDVPNYGANLRFPDLTYSNDLASFGSNPYLAMQTTVCNQVD